LPAIESWQSTCIHLKVFAHARIFEIVRDNIYKCGTT